MAPADYAFVALGSNLGDSAAIVRLAVQRLQALSDRPLLKSSLWRSTPVDCPPGSALFLNAVVGLEPQLAETPESLLDRLQALEREFGREPKKTLNEPRPLDLDLITFRSVVCATARLTLPHPRARFRRFVLQPLAEIAPDLFFPREIIAVGELLRRLGSSEVLSRVEPGL